MEETLGDESGKCEATSLGNAGDEYGDLQVTTLGIARVRRFGNDQEVASIWPGWE